MSRIKSKGSTPVLGQAVLELGPLGPVRIAWSERGLRQLRFDVDEQVESLADVRLYKRAPAVYGKALRAYAKGKAVSLLDVPVDSVGTEFQKRVWAALRLIPRGKVRTYGGVAADIGKPRGSRAVGMANGRNPVPVVIPCHRVVGAGHALGGYSGGIERKRTLLTLEGVVLDGEQVRPGQLVLL